MNGLVFIDGYPHPVLDVIENEVAKLYYEWIDVKDTKTLRMRFLREKDEEKSKALYLLLNIAQGKPIPTVANN